MLLRPPLDTQIGELDDADVDSITPHVHVGGVMIPESRYRQPTYSTRNRGSTRAVSGAQSKPWCDVSLSV